MDSHVRQDRESYCIFRQGVAWFALPALSVREVAPRPLLVPVPAAPPLLAGLCQLRSEFLAVVRLDALAGDGRSVLERGEQLVALEGPAGVWAVLVDQVAGIAALEVSIDPECKVADRWPAALLGSATYRDQVVRVLDPNRLYRLAERELSEGWQVVPGNVPLTTVGDASPLAAVSPGGRS